MNRLEYLLTTLSEECAEVSHRACKAARFGMDEIQPGQNQTNSERLSGELTDLFVIVQLLSEEYEQDLLRPDKESVSAKRDKFEKFLRYSAECGTYQPK